jgi:hypothetical protein
MAVAGSLAVAIGTRNVFVVCGGVVLLAAAVSAVLLRGASAPEPAPEPAVEPAVG